jgi:UDP-N-acetylmuramate--alanine ligase
MNKVFMVGISGIGMSRLALALSDLGFDVYGTDVNLSLALNSLAPYGIKIVDDNFELDKSFDVVVYSSAVPKTNKFIHSSKNLGILIKARGEMLADIALPYKEIVISGTHGKTTTTAMIGALLSDNFKTNIYVGAEVPFNNFYKEADYFVLESDESDKTFLLLQPYFLVLTNVDRDHLNAYNNDFNELKKAFSNVLQKSHIKVVSMDDTVAYSLASQFGKETYYYSLNNSSANAFSNNIVYRSDGITFDIQINEKLIKGIRLKTFGLQNVSNAIAAALTADLLNVSNENIIDGFSKFTMPARRLEKKGEVDGIILFDDHADHPSEVEATLDALRKHFPQRRIIAVFQPHRYTRMDALRESVAKPFYLADSVIVNDIFAAFEDPIEGISGEVVTSWIKENNHSKDVYFVKDLKDIPDAILRIAQTGDIIVLLGPGNIGEIALPILDKLKEKI